MRRLYRNLVQLIRASERYTKTDMVYLTHGGFWLFLGQGLGAVLSIGLAIAFANLIEPEKYGNYKYVLTLASAIGALSLTGLSSALTRAAAHGHTGTLRSANRLALKTSFGMMLVAGAVSAYYALNGNTFLATSLLIVGAAMPVITSFGLYRPFLMGVKNFRGAALWGALQSAAPTLAVLLGIVSGLPILALIALYFGTSAVVVYYIFVHAAPAPEDQRVDEHVPTLSAHLSVMGIIATIADRLDSILVFQYLGGAELAAFALATSLPDAVRGSLKNITALALPKFAGKAKDELKKIIAERSWLIVLGASALALGYVLAAPSIFAFVFPQYQHAVLLSQVYAITIPISLVLTSAYFDIQGVVRERYVINGIDSVTRIIFTFVGLYFFGLMGAILARIGARAVKAGVTTYVLWRL